MQNRRAIRIEYCVDRSRLHLWTSPRAGRSLDYRDRNWSNRDDHTAIFERILMPGLDLGSFRGADWDPFHSVPRFERQTLHLAQVYDQPAVLLWLEGKWEVENVGISPDVEVELDPKAWRQGHDAQLEKAVEVALADLEKHPRPVHQRPEYPNYHRKPATAP